MSRDSAAAAPPIQDSERNALGIKTRLSESFSDQVEISRTCFIKDRDIVTASDQVYKAYRWKRNFSLIPHGHSALHPNPLSSETPSAVPVYLVA
jgi:hypothetical protein